jgi:hypothetical protein
MLFATLAIAQQTIKGTIKDAETKQPLPDAIVKILDGNASVRTDEKGQFRMTKLPKGKKTLIISLKDHKTITQDVDSNEPLVKLGTIELGKPDVLPDAIQTIILDNEDSNSETSEEQNIASQLGTSRDLFSQYSNYSWFPARYRVRGYLSNYNESFVNGVPFNDLNDDRAPFSEYSGLNDVTRRNRQDYQGLSPSNFAFGDLAGSNNLDTRASYHRKQTRVSYMNANRNFSHRLMATYSTGLTPKNWAFTASGSRRWAQEGYVTGTFYDAYSYFVSVDKVLGNNHVLNLTILDAPTKNANGGNTTLEMVNYSGDKYYNHNWGYQNGKKRNYAVNNRQAPTAILRHDFKINEHSNLATSASFQLESNHRGAIEWINARDPRPDYYSTVPSGFDDEYQRQKGIELFTSSEAVRQIDWDYLYQTNYKNIQTVNNTTGKRAQYMLFDNVTNTKEASLYSNYQNTVNDHLQLSGGAAYRYFQSEDYRQLTDLLGADYSVDIDKFADRDPNRPTDTLFSQNDIGRQNRILKVGDKFGYDYKVNVQNAYVWGQSVWSYSHFDFFLAAKGSTTSFFREGLNQNGRFPTNSLGKSAVGTFLNYGVKGGFTYKLNGRNYFNFYAGYTTKAPNSRDAFLSPRTRNSLVPDLKSEKILSGEVAYNYRSPMFSAQLTGYYTFFKDKIKASTFYSDEDQSFVNYVAQGLDMRHAGVELAAEYKLTSQLEVFVAGVLSQSLYWSRPTAIATPDNGITSKQSNLNGQTVYIKGYYLANTPQNAASAGLKYIGKKFWGMNLSANYFGKRYMDINYNRRTDYAVSLPYNTDVKKANLAPDTKLWHEIIDQQKLDDAITINISGNKSFKYKKYYINFSTGIDNVLNNKFVSSAFEQWRFDAVNKNINKFPPRYYFASGRNYYAQIALRF